MHPYLIDLGHVTLPLLGEVRLALPTYGALVATALVVSWFWFFRNVRRERLPLETCASIAFWTLVGGLVGGKLGLVLVDIGWYASNPRQLLSPDLLTAAGVVWSAVFGGIVTLVFLAWRHSVPIGPLIDAAALPLPLAQVIGRMGCLMAGCCYGSVCHMPWAVVYRSQDAQLRTGVTLNVPLHPAPIYEALWSLAIVLPGLLIIRSRRRVAGEVALAYLFLYSIGRFAVEFFRGDSMRGLWFDGRLSTGQMVSMVVAPVALAFWVRLRARAKSVGDLPAHHDRPGGESSARP